MELINGGDISDLMDRAASKEFQNVHHFVMSPSNFLSSSLGSFSRGLDTNYALTVSVCPFSEVGSSDVDGIGFILGVETAGNTASSRAITNFTLS